MLIADDLGGWLVGLLADAGRKKLTAFILGDEQERALRQAAIAAVQSTADEVSPSRKQAEQVMMVISEVFRDPMPGGRLADQPTLLEALQAGITRQLAVLDDASLTGTTPPQSSAQILGVPAVVLAQKLTSHLVREILLRGSRGGPLTPLASQFNHERTQGMLAGLTREVREALGQVPKSSVAAWRPLEEVTDPFALEVHAAVQPDSPQPGLPALPEYVPRQHDVELARVVASAARGTSGIAVLVGGSSTGKTRACWEALRLLRGQEPRWWLWHPIDPSRPEAALRELSAIGPRTGVWLNEAQFYLNVPNGDLGERVAAGLRELLRQPDRGPVLVLATMWPTFWNVLTSRPPAGPDLHEQARELLTGHNMMVPEEFTAAQVEQLHLARDPRLAAAAGAHDRQVVQYLAGAPRLVDRYQTAPPAAKALIEGAMDARRMGMRPALTHAFLEAVTPGYLSDSEWDALADDWLEQGLTYTGAYCGGIRGPLTGIRPRAPKPGEPSPGRHMAAYRLADYLEQYGRRVRADQLPPATFWEAAAAHADAREAYAVGLNAYLRGLYRYAAQLWKNSITHDSAAAVQLLVILKKTDRDMIGEAARWIAAKIPIDDLSQIARLLEWLHKEGLQEATAILATRIAHNAPLDNWKHFGDLLKVQSQFDAQMATTLAERAAHTVSLRSPSLIARLLRWLKEADMHQAITVLLARDPARAVHLDDLFGVGDLLHVLDTLGAREQITALLARDLARFVPLDEPSEVADLLRTLENLGARDTIEALVARHPAGIVDLASCPAPLIKVLSLVNTLLRLGAQEEAINLADRAARNGPLDEPDLVGFMLKNLRAIGAWEATVALAERAARSTPLENSTGDQVEALLKALREVGAHEEAEVLSDRIASLNNPGATAYLLEALQQEGAEKTLVKAAVRVARTVPLNNPYELVTVLRQLLNAGQQEAIETLIARNLPRTFPIDDPFGVSLMLQALRTAGAPEAVQALLARDPARTVKLDDPARVVRLIEALRAAGAQEAVEALLARDPARAVKLDDPIGVSLMLEALRTAGAQEAVQALLARDPARTVKLDDPAREAPLREILRGEKPYKKFPARLADEPAMLDRNKGITLLLKAFLEAGSRESATALTVRAADGGRFEIFLKLQSCQYGRELDRSPSPPWGWADLT